MKLEYDKDADAAYIYVDHPIKPGEAKNTVELSDNIFLDFDAGGRLLGMEILNASKVLKKDILVKCCC